MNNNLCYKNWHVFCLDKEHFLLNYWNYNIEKISEEEYKLLSKYESIELENLEEELDLISRKYNIISYNHNIDDVINKSIRTASFSFAPEHGCNLSCKYCFANSGENFVNSTKIMTKEVLKSTLDYVCFQLFPNFSSYRLDFVSGGEPLLNFETIKYAIEYGKNLKEKTGKNLFVFLVTNGTINNEKYWNYLIQNNVSLGISIDGNKNTHDKVRVFKNGSGTYDVIKKNTYILLNSGDSSHSFKNIWCLMVITSQTTSIVDCLTEIKKLGFKRIQTKIVRLPKTNKLSINNNNIKDLKNNYKRLFDFLFRNICDNDLTNLKMLLNDSDYFGKYICRLILRYKNPYRCGAGKNKVSFDALGNIYPCPSFVGIEKYRLGTIYKRYEKRISLFFSFV